MVAEKQRQQINTYFIYGVIALLSMILTLSLFKTLPIQLETSHLIIILVIAVLLLFRYFDAVEIPGLLKFRKEIEEIKTETKEIRQGQMTLMQALSISQSATAASHVYIHPIIQGATTEAAQEATTLLEEPPSVGNAALNTSLEAIRNETDQIQLHVQRGEFYAAFVLMRKRIDSLLRDILGAGPGDIRSFHELIRDARKIELISPSLLESLSSVRRFANIVIHMPTTEERHLSMDDVEKIVNLGIRTMGELEAIKARISARRSSR